MLGGRGQTALVHVETCFTVLDHVDKLGLQQLPVEVGDGVLEGVLVALLAFALVAASLETSAQDGDAVRGLLVTLVGVLEGVGDVVLVRALVDVQHPEDMKIESFTS